MTRRTDAERAYCGQQGHEYWERNAAVVRSQQSARTAALRRLISPQYEAFDWLEVGAGRGDNLCPGDVALDCDARQLQHLPSGVVGVIGHAYDLPFPDRHFPVVLSIGCLMHIPSHHGDWGAYPTSVERALAEMIRVSSKYVVLGEYLAATEIPITGKHWDGMLWARPYSHSYLHLLSTTHFLAPFDPGVTFLIFETRS